MKAPQRRSEALQSLSAPRAWLTTPNSPNQPKNAFQGAYALYFGSAGAGRSTPNTTALLSLVTCPRVNMPTCTQLDATPITEKRGAPAGGEFLFRARRIIAMVIPIIQTEILARNRAGTLVLSGFSLFISLCVEKTATLRASRYDSWVVACRKLKVL
jgi:hypothetical protein